jgi:PEP-CTERM motif
MHPWMRGLLLLVSLQALSCLVAAPSYALNLTTTGPALTQCGDQMCVDLDWFVEVDTANGDAKAGEAILDLPRLNPSAWQLTSGYISGISAGGNYWGWYDAIYPPFTPNVVTPVGYLIGADGARMMDWLVGLGVWCLSNGTFPVGPPVVCGDGNAGSSGGTYTAVTSDPAFDGPLTVRYEYIGEPQTLDPFQESYWFSFGAQLHLEYSPVPEPSTGLLVMAGLLGLAYRKRRPVIERDLGFASFGASQTPSDETALSDSGGRHRIDRQR